MKSARSISKSRRARLKKIQQASDMVTNYLLELEKYVDRKAVNTNPAFRSLYYLEALARRAPS